jgi:hypothetical protein
MAIVLAIYVHDMAYAWAMLKKRSNGAQLGTMTPGF